MKRPIDDRSRAPIRRLRLGTRLFSLLLFAIAASACGPPVINATRPSSASVIASPPDLATIVVVQPKIWLLPVSILDGNGMLVGQVLPKAHTALQLPPGPVRLYVLPADADDAGDSISGSVESGKRYYAHIGFRWGGLYFTPLTPRSGGPWDDRARMLEGPFLELDPAQTAQAATGLGDTKKILRTIDARTAKFDAAERDAHTIRPEDGE